MREILFRGKRIDNGEWIEGSLWIIDKFYILTTANCVGFEVDPKSVGQYIGENDANGTKIFEDDILTSADFDEEDGYGIVAWDDAAFEVSCHSWCGTFHENFYGGDFEVIGNIHDNPELLGGVEEDG